MMDDLRTYGQRATQIAITEEKKLPCPTTHTLLRGETLSGVAAAYGVTLDELLAANPTLDPNASLRAGTQICIPTAPEPTVPETEQACCEQGMLYCVRSGDTLLGIADRFGVTEEQLLAANPVLVQLGSLVVGQIICIPSSGIVAPPECAPGTVDQIVITQGTSFSDILTAYDLSLSALRLMNPNVNLDQLDVGQVLCLPANGTRGICADCENAYMIEQGDSLDSIAQALGTTVEALIQANPVLLPSDFAPGAIICAQ